MRAVDAGRIARPSTRGRDRVQAAKSDTAADRRSSSAVGELHVGPEVLNAVDTPSTAAAPRRPPRCRRRPGRRVTLGAGGAPTARTGLDAVVSELGACASRSTPGLNGAIGSQVEDVVEETSAASGACRTSVFAPVADVAPASGSGRPRRCLAGRRHRRPRGPARSSSCRAHNGRATRRGKERVVDLDAFRARSRACWSRNGTTHGSVNLRRSGASGQPRRSRGVARRGTGGRAGRRRARVDGTGRRTSTCHV